MVRIEIAPDQNALNGRDCSSDHVMDVRQELCDRDFAFLNVLAVSASLSP
jgi:hypothetical protein